MAYIMCGGRCFENRPGFVSQQKNTTLFNVNSLKTNPNHMIHILLADIVEL